MKKQLILSGVIIGAITAIGSVILISLLFPYFSVSAEESGEIVNDYWKTHYFDNGVGESTVGLFIMCVIGAISSSLCFHFAKKQ